MSKARITSWLVVGGLAMGLSAATAKAENLPAIDPNGPQAVIIDRGAVDGGAGQLWAYRQPFHVAERVATWSFYDNDTSAGEQITPVIWTRLNSGTGTFRIVGIGTTRTSNNSGAQSFAFGLVAGTDIVAGTAGTTDATNGAFYLGWFNGATNGTGVGGSQNSGVINFDGVGPGDWTLFDGGGTNPTTITAGADHTATAGFGRFYSVQFQTAPVPEPAGLALLGAVGAAATLRRRRKLA